VSTLFTDRERERLAAEVPEVFEPTDPSVERVQEARARSAFGLLQQQRGDPLGDVARQVQDLVAVAELATMDAETIRRLLELDDETWAVLKSEVPLVVAQTLRAPVRPDTVNIARTSARSNVGRAIDAETAALIAHVAGGFVVPNTQIDVVRTDLARRDAAEAVEPVVRTVVAGQTVAREGDLVTPEALEVMEALGLLRGRLSARHVASGLLYAALLVLSATAMLWRLRPRFWLRPRQVALFVLVILPFAFGARFAVPERLVLSLAYPGAAAAMTLAVILGADVGIAAAVVLAGVIGYLGGTALEPAVYAFLGSLVGAMVLGRVERLTAFVAAGLAVAASNLAVILAFRLPDGVPDLQAAAELSGAALISAVLATGLCAVGYLSAGSLLGLATSVRLLELARPDHPLLRRLQMAAPGTYHHSVLLGNLAEQAAHAVGANALLVRVGAYYHDVGKLRRPFFFVENQAPGLNPHENLDAYASARIVISHVADGAELCRSHGIPEEIVDFVRQHHGTTRAEFFYRKAVDLLGEELVDEAAFRYPGPRPTTREAALLMLADGSEAAVRAAAPETREGTDEVVSRIIRSRLNAGELDDSQLTLHDLKVVRRVFVEAFGSVRHPRVQYPPEIGVGLDKIRLSPGAAAGAEATSTGMPRTAEQGSHGPAPGDQRAADAAEEEHIAASVADPKETGAAG
jgi:putative nucleotidyltransferase with HDIG domain